MNSNLLASASASPANFKMQIGRMAITEIAYRCFDSERAAYVLLSIGTWNDPLKPACPICYREMQLVQRNDDKGYFWGCPNYPKCLGKRSYEGGITHYKDD